MYMEAAPTPATPTTPAAPATAAPAAGPPTAPATAAHAGGKAAAGKPAPAGTVATGSRALFAVLLAQQEGTVKASGPAKMAKATACAVPDKAHPIKGDDQAAATTDAVAPATVPVVQVPAAKAAATTETTAKACPATPAQATAAIPPAQTEPAATATSGTAAVAADALKAEAAGSGPATAPTAANAVAAAVAPSDPAPAASPPSVVVTGLRPVTQTATVKPAPRPAGSHLRDDPAPAGSAATAPGTPARHPAVHAESRVAPIGPADRPSDRSAIVPQPVVQVAPRREAPADAPQAPQPPAPLDRERFDRLVDGLAARLKLSQAGDGARVRMQLDPKELGEVVVRLQIRDGVAQASLIADNRDAGRVLQSAIADLRSGLADRGVQLDRVDVRVAGDGAGRQHEPRNSHGHHHGHRHASGGLLAQIGSIDPGLSTPDSAVPAGSVSILA
jgi:flagellar hook-length control protein FliK